MAHFARIDKNTHKVLRVHVVSNERATTEQNGIDFLLEVHKNQPWINDVYFVQTSYNANFRQKFAGIGDEWHESLNAFIRKPFPSWVLNETKKIYEAPKEKPDGDYYWDEQYLDWIENN